MEVEILKNFKIISSSVLKSQRVTLSAKYLDRQ
ncbi:hypothetical protein D3OALGB2SA_4056 [Olavius algarvensis associated proteobacterium Delta 3]|nr:hypothetical protein D3OALGB2SA_4056 [Olavius algarvensis associated proteobacterium Delta 3]